MAELPLEVVKLIYKAFCKIKKVVKTLDQNNEDIRNFEQLVESWSQILAPLEKNTAMLEDAGISTAVKYLWESLQRAQDQIQSDTGSNRVSRALKAEDKANKLRRLHQEINNKMITVTATIAMYSSFASITQISRPPSESEPQEEVRKSKDDIHNIPIPEFHEAVEQESLQVGLLHQDMKLEIHEAAQKFYDDTKLMKTKIHRYPPSIQNLGSWYTVPRIVAIGPYHRGKEQLKHAENVKHVAAYYCIKDSGHWLPDMYDAVIRVVEEIDARRLYNKDEMEGIRDDDFLPMMFFDACFLVMYMLKLSGKPCKPMLYDFFESNANDIDHDIMLLENQIPWPVVDAIIKYTSVTLEEFIAQWNDGRLQDQVDPVRTVMFDDSFEPPHLLGLLRFYIVGTSSSTRRTIVHGLEKMTLVPSISAIELAKMGIKLTANKTTELPDMGLTEKRIFFAKLSMAPLSLNDLRANLLVNMAALELCTTPDFFDSEAEYEASAVCSYLRLLCMLMHREEDVHELRTKGILQGGAEFTNKKALDLFTSLQSLRMGPCCAHVVQQIANYKVRRAMRIKAYTFLGLVLRFRGSTKIKNEALLVKTHI